MIKGMDETLKAFKNMKESLPKWEVRALIHSAMEPMVHAVSAAATKAGLPPDSYKFIDKNDAKYINDKKVTVLSGFKLGTNSFRKLGLKQSGEDPRFHLLIWREFGTVQRYKKDGSSTGYIKPSQLVRPLLDSHKARIFNEVKDGLIEMVNYEAKLNKLK